MKDVLYFCIKGWWDWIRLVLIWMWCAWKHDVTLVQALCEQPDKTFLKLKPGTLPCWFTFYVIVRTNDVCVYNIYILESSSQLFMFFSLFHYVKILVIFYSIWWVHLALIYMEGQASGCQFGKTDEWHCMTTCFYSNWSVKIPVGFPASVLFSLHVYSVGYIQAALNTQFCQISLCACMLQGSQSIIENRYFALLTAFSHCSVDSLCCKCTIDTANKCCTFL